jgi:hypothetical protein
MVGREGWEGVGLFCCCFVYVFAFGLWSWGLNSDFKLARQVLYYLTTPPALFALFISEIGSCFFVLGCDLLFYAVHNRWTDRQTTSCPNFFH